jgi:archaellum component FlaC|tara:strand:+ start:303 stop:527 length:225 start_codon:yes stop_codon:yes gene_type:complete
MFGNSRKIKDLEKQIEDLKSLCTHLTNNVITLMQEQAVIAQAVKSLLESQKVVNKIISTNHGIPAANDDDDIIH